MPTTRSQKSPSNAVESSTSATATDSAATATTTSYTDTTSGTAATTTDYTTTDSTTTDATATDSTATAGTAETRTPRTPSAPRSAASRSKPVEHEGRSSRTPSVARSTSSKRRRDLAKAREELLQKKVELAAARVAALEEESDEEDDITVRDERTTEWIQNSTLALTSKPHNPENATCTLDRRILPDEDEHRAPMPQTCNDALRPEDNATCSVERIDVPDQTQETARAKEHVRRYNEPHREPCLYPASMPAQQYDARGPIEESHRPEAPLLPLTQHLGNELVPRNDYRQLSDAITLAARAVMPVNTLRNQELPTFNGAASEWLPYKTAYEESAHALSEQENLSRLRRSLRGAARDAVQCLFIGATTAVEVLKLLSSRFGRPDALVMAEMNKLRALPRLSENPRDICIFASKVLNVTATVKALKKCHYLYNSEVVRGVVEKLPSALRYRYYDFTAEEPEEQPDLVTCQVQISTEF